jgi:hypothetical protein
MGDGDVRNARENAVARFCLTMEEHRRTEAGRVRTAREMVDFFFPRGPSGNVVEDRIFVYMPAKVRGPILSGWGIRGRNSAMRDTDDRVRSVVEDALLAGDIDEATFEQGVDAQTLIDWVPLHEWWNFWRTGRLTMLAIQKALYAARDLALFDDAWFLRHVEGRGGKLKGTDTICDTLSKDQVTAWVRKIHEFGDGSPAGIVRALGWETTLAKTSQEALLFALDALARKANLVVDPATPNSTVKPSDALTATPAPDDNVAVPDIPPL